MSGEEGRNPFEDYLAINKELEAYDESILDRPQIIVATKMDLPESNDNLAEFKQQIAEDDRGKDFEVLPISSVTHDGLQELVQKTADLLEQTTIIPTKPLEETAEYEYHKTSDDLNISFDDEIDSWVIKGAEIERLFKMTDTMHEQSMLRFARQMRGMGIDKALRDAGAKDGDTVTILDFSFTYVD